MTKRRNVDYQKDYRNKVSLNTLFNNIPSCDEGAQEIVIKKSSTIS